MGVDRAGGGRLEFKRLSTGSLVRPGFSNVEAFGFQRFHAIWIWVILGRNAKRVSWPALANILE
jgi:hypothetical protein